MTTDADHAARSTTQGPHNSKNGAAGYEDVEAVIDRLYQDENFRNAMRMLGENPKPIKVCTGCWFELRSARDVEEHVCPPMP